MSGGICVRCGAPDAPVVTYFGLELCHLCAQAAADYFDGKGRWPPLPPAWQAELDALGPWPNHRDDQLRIRELGSVAAVPVTPEPCPDDVVQTEPHLWVPCSVCGVGMLVSLTRANGKSRTVWPDCRVTHGCTGRHEPQRSNNL